MLSLLFERKVPSHWIRYLKNTLRILEEKPASPGKTYVFLEGLKTVELDLSYETGEMKKDILFLELGPEAFDRYLEELYPGFNDQVKGLSEFLQGELPQNFLTDRDGTVNNYCAHYRTSVQSVYNAFWLSRFAVKLHGNSMILTSAPLRNKGLVDISTAPTGTFFYAGSKGRECQTRSGGRLVFPVPEHRQKKLDVFNRRVQNLLSKKRFRKFSLIGSGLQLKFGQTTIARQDVEESVLPEVSDSFLEKIKNIISTLDPEGTLFHIVDTGLDIEVLLTVQDEPEAEGHSEYDKGVGVLFMNRQLGLGFEKGWNLVCGDTESDVPMVEALMSLTPDTRTVFVTENEDLKARVRALCPNSYFVAQPDVLVRALSGLVV